VLGSRRVRAIGLTAIVVLGLVLRALGVRLGLPYGHHWDEGWIVDSIIHMRSTETLVPEHYMYGAPLMELGLVVFQAYTHLVRELSPHDGTMLRWMVRGVSVVISSSGTVAVYLAARWGDWNARRSAWVAVLAALLYATASELVTHARYGVTDACLVALTAWTLAFTARYVRGQQLGWGFAALVAAGVTMGFKVTSAPTALIPVAALVLVPGRLARLRSSLPYRVLLAAALPAVVATFIGLNPMFAHVDHWRDAIGDVLSRALQTHYGGFPEYQLREPGWPHLVAAWSALGSLALHRTPAVSIVLAAISAGGLVSAVRRRNLFYALAAGHAVIAVFVLAWPNRAFLLRNYLVATPALCPGFGFGAWELARRVAARVEGRRARWALLALAGAATGVALVALPVHDAVACQTLSEDPRQRAMDWIAAHGAPGSRVAYTPSVIGDVAMGKYDRFDDTLPRSGTPDVRSCRDVTGASPPLQYVITASYRDDENWVTYEDLWFFQECPPYREVARFEPNPYEHNFAVTPPWNGRTTAIVLERQR
jgi:hypothetical protein